MPRHTKYTKEILISAVENSTSFAGVLRYLGRPQAGGTQAHIAKQIRLFEIDTSHFKGKAWNKGRTDLKKKSASEILIQLPEGSSRTGRAQLYRAMIESGKEYLCKCGLGPEWQGQKLTLEINHIDGNWLNNSKDNLEFLCPNCHSQEEHTNKPYKYRNNKEIFKEGEY